MLKRVLKWFAIGAGALIVVVLIGGRIYQVSAESSDLERYPPPGELIDVGGHAMHIHCQGQGTPTVVVEQGLGNVSSSWDEIHRQIARTTRVCAYDRAGMGYSEPVGRPVQAAEVAGLLNKLLHGAGIDDDLVMVGWSAGGVYIREFHRQFPDRVKAMLFVDSSHEQQADRLPPFPGGDGGNAMMTVAKYLAPFGLVRVSGIVDEQMASLPGSDDLRANLVALYNQSHAVEALMNESDAFSVDIRAPEPPASLGDLPLIVLSQGKPVEVSDDMPPDVTLEYLEEQRRVWNELQIELTALSSHGWQIVATESGHAIHADQPEMLVESVNELVKLARTR